MAVARVADGSGVGQKVVASPFPGGVRMVPIARGMCIHAHFRGVRVPNAGEMADGKRERPRRRCHPAGTTAAEPVGALGCGSDGRKVRRAPHGAHHEEDRVTAPELEPLPDGVLETLRQVSTSTIATQLYKRGFRQPQLLGVKPISEVADGFVGEAFTMRFIPMREDVDGVDPYRSGNTLQWEAFEALQPGQVLVVDSYRTATAASGGDMLMTRAWKRGAAAVVTDGGLRDGHVLAQMPFPTYASEITITTRAAQHHVADLNVPIGCAGVAVYPGDVLIGDRDGVLVIPRHLAAEVAEQGLEQEKLEAFVSTKIHAGEPLWGNYPPGDELKAEYQASLKEADGSPGPGENPS
jgi:regulator of RNase E activity RraA